MTVRGGGIPRRPLALTPNGRMGPPLRSFAADAHDCIMVRVLGPTGYKVVARLNRAPKAGSPLIVIATALSVPSCSKPSRYGLARAKHAARLVRRPILTASARIDLSDARVGMKKRTLRSNQETDEGKRCAALANSLTKKAPYKGLGADSVEKHEPVSDIDTVVVDSLKALDPKRPIREADIVDAFWHFRFVPLADKHVTLRGCARGYFDFIRPPSTLRAARYRELHCPCGSRDRPSRVRWSCDP